MSTLSVVMPCLHAVGTIERSLDSIRSLRGVEVVVVDGGSTDGTLDVLRRRSGISWTTEPDTGLSNAFNKGARRASGDVLGWLNADDVYLPGALDRVRDAFERHADLVWLTGRCLIVDASGREIRRGVTRYKNVLLRRYSHRLHLTHNFVSAPSTFFRRDAFLELGGMDEALRYSMDYDLYLRLGARAAPAVLDEDLAAFTMAEGTLSMIGFTTQFAEHEAVARRHGGQARSAVAVNAGLSRAIVLSYQGMRLARRLRSDRRSAAPPDLPSG